jgi:hypothetical protein
MCIYYVLFISHLFLYILLQIRFLFFTQFSYCHLFVSVGVLHVIFIQGSQNYQQLKYIQCLGVYEFYVTTSSSCFVGKVFQMYYRSIRT